MSFTLTYSQRTWLCVSRSGSGVGSGTARNRLESSWNRDSRIEEFGSVMEAYDSKVEASVVQIGSVREDDVQGR
ncbi:hypothetical protein F2Q68_00006361 [Brassica cretica]|uniref:Uncharacterized protein n=1 Tax=Brassica cretica TaxID=69181 RepID=A0A8S9J4B0_BRACR|nr:hypothetical protein F2Q68_00006361 [Brassica cretica]